MFHRASRISLLGLTLGCLCGVLTAPVAAQAPPRQALPDPARALLTADELGPGWQCSEPVRAPASPDQPNGPSVIARTLCSREADADGPALLLGNVVVLLTDTLPPTTLVTVGELLSTARPYAQVDRLPGPPRLEGPRIGTGTNWDLATGTRNGAPVEIPFVIFQVNRASAGLFVMVEPGTPMVESMTGWAEPVSARLAEMAPHVPPARR